MYSVNNGSGNRIIVTFQEQRAKEIYEEYRFFDPKAAYYPAKDILFYQSDIRGNVLTAERINALKMLAEESSCTIITTFDALMNPMPMPEKFIQEVKKVSVGDILNLEELTKHLVELGYEKNYQAETMGEFSVRGGILDIFPLTEDNPFRIEFWGDEVDSIRSFDAESQRSIENLEEISIYPACELVLTAEERQEGIKRILKEADKVSAKLRKEMKTEEAHRTKSAAAQIAEEAGELGISAGLDAYLSYFCEERVSLLDYFNRENTVIFVDELARSIERGMVTETEFSESMKQRLEKGYILPGQMRELFSCKEILAKMEKMACISLVALDLKNSHVDIKEKFVIDSKTVNPYNNSFDLLVKDLTRYKKNGYRVILLSGSRTRAKRLTEDLMAEELNAFYSEDFDHEVKPGEIMTGYGKIKKGYEYPLLKFVVISESDIFGSEKKKKKHHRTYEGEKIASFTDLNIGDYVVHENHGLGIYRGIEKIEVDKTVKDYIKIEYAGGGNLYILATQLELIQKYAGADAKKPKLNKLGGQEWNKTKTKVRGAVKEIAKDLVKLYAQRQDQEGFVYGPDTVWQREFEEMFPFEETEDQELAIEATKKDMESTKIMDRLICGDVGFGKTEVAIRAAFKCVTGGRQAAVLVPTTVLAEQHFRTFKERMSEYPVRIEMLSRFSSAANIRSTLEGLRTGAVDIVIGTHRLISDDVSMKNLGLVVIDEEQRFGVRHKEKFKERFKGIDVLTLSATPIPRTLYIALMGARDMSSIETPPVNRQPVQTSVCPYDERIMKKAMERELERGGQIFLLHNRVKTIELFRDRIQALVPKARIVIGHGQMPKEELEKVMRTFVQGKADILLATTIIESGIDIPNANTIIIDRADRFGLADLYQLRGRVGRAGHRAYAYLMLPRSAATTGDARKRVSAIKQYTELGSGFKIAMRDLEIRGAGNLLGTQQSGHIAAIGFDLYCQLLQQSIAQMQGKRTAPRPDAALRTDFIINSETQFAAKSRKDYLGAFLPREYISDAALRISAYKDLAAVRTLKEADNLLRAWEDRFGPAPETVRHLLDSHKIKILASHANISMVEISGQRLMLTRNGDFILLSNKFPRLASAAPADKLRETLDMLKNI